MKLAKLTGALVGAVSILAAPIAGATPVDEPDSGVVDTEHKPGTPGYGDMVPEDLTVPVGSPGALPETEPDADGQVPHICAGKKLLHHSHVDAAYVTRVNEMFTVTVVDGQQVVKDPSKICIRLAPDARHADGNEVSRMVVPADDHYRFLGTPGDILWRAPQEQVDNWRPVWAGIGAFDTNHEVSHPEGILLDEVKLHLVDTKGPGDIEVWRTTGMTGLTRGMSSSSDLSPLSIQAGSHGHWNWTFTEAGVYELGLSASYTSEWNGMSIKSRPSYVTWLVGSDEEVGLPSGTTTGLNLIRSSTEDQQAAMANAGEFDGVETAPNEPEGPLTPESARAQIRDIAGSRPPTPTTKPQDYVYKGSFIEDVRDGAPFNRVVLTVEDSSGQRVSGSPVVEVPDSLMQETASGNRWVLPATGEHGSLIFDFTAMPVERRSTPAVYSIDTFSGPDGGRHLAGVANGGELEVKLDSQKDPNRGYTMRADTVPLQHVFTKPGLYSVGFNIETTDANGQFSYKYQSAYFVVGDSSIDELRKMTGVEPKAPMEPVEPAPDPDPSEEPSSSAEPEQTLPVDPSEPTQPGAQPGDEKTVVPAPEIHVITHGHMDQALAYQGSDVRVFVDDTADPRNPRRRESGTFAYAVPDSAFAVVPETARGGYEKLREMSPEGLWILPEAQLEGLPWVGFSTQRVKYDLLDERGVHVEMRNFEGPGRVVTAHSKLTGPEFLLDSDNRESTIEYPFGSHDHQAWYFTKPGQYTMDFVYVLHHKDGTTTQSTLSTMFLVGDEAVSTGPLEGDGIAEPGVEEPEGEDLDAPGEPEGKLPIDDLVDKLNAEERGQEWEGPSGESDGAQLVPIQPTAPRTPVGKQPFGKPVTESPVSNRNSGPTQARHLTEHHVAKSSVTGPDGMTNAGLTHTNSTGANAAESFTNVPLQARGTPQGVLFDAPRQTIDINNGGNLDFPIGGGTNVAEGTENTASEGTDLLDGLELSDEGTVVSSQDGNELSDARVTALEKPAQPVSALLNPDRGAQVHEESGTPLWQWLLIALGVIGLTGAAGWSITSRNRP